MIDLDFDKIKRIYFVGIKGVGMTPLAVIAKEAGFAVGGSDVGEEFLTDEILKKNNITFDIGFDQPRIAEFIGALGDETLVITTAANSGLQNPQCKYALELGLPVITHGQAVGLFMKGEILYRKFEGVSILGCHGKTTVSAMAATLFSKSGLDPSYAVGTSELFPLGNPGHLGDGKYFIAEADEFVSDMELDRTVKFLYQFPKYAIINNIDFDHPDVYKNLEEVKQTFLKFCIKNIKERGVLVANGDDLNLKSIIHNSKFKILRLDVKVITYGAGEENDFRIVNFKEKGWGSEFEVFAKGESMGTFNLYVPGFYNAKNVLSVISLLSHLGVKTSVIQKAVGQFKGTKRRQEIIGKTKEGAVIIDDYAHHPDEIEKTLTAVKKAYPEKHIVCLFQPHTLSRTIALQDEFIKVFSKADDVLFLPIFTSKREGEVTYESLYTKIKQEMEKQGQKVMFFESRRAREELEYSPYFFHKHRVPVVEYIASRFGSERHVIVALGAGDLYKIAYDLIGR